MAKNICITFLLFSITFLTGAQKSPVLERHNPLKRTSFIPTLKKSRNHKRKVIRIAPGFPSPYASPTTSTTSQEDISLEESNS